MDDLQKQIADAIEPELDKREMVDAAPSVIRRLQAERIARTVLAIPEISAALSFHDQWTNAGPHEREAIIADMMERRKAEHYRPDLGHSIRVRDPD